MLGGNILVIKRTCGFKIICNITEVKKLFVGILNFPTHKKHEIKCPTKIIDFTVQYFDNY